MVRILTDITKLSAQSTIHLMSGIITSSMFSQGMYWHQQLQNNY